MRQRRHGIVAAAGHVERFSVRRKGQADRHAAQRGIRKGRNFHIRSRQRGRIQERNRIRKGVGHRQRRFAGIERQLRRLQTDRNIADREGRGVHFAQCPRCRRAGDGVGENGRTARWRSSLARIRPAPATVGDVDLTALRNDHSERGHPDIHLLADFVRGGVDHGQSIRAAEGHVGRPAVRRKRDPHRQGMPWERKAAGLHRHPYIGKLRNQDAVRSAAGGLTGPQLTVPGAERDAGVGRSPLGDAVGRRGNLSQLGAGGCLEELHGVGVEDRQHALAGVERHVDGPAGDDALLAPGAQHLAGGNQINAIGLFAHGGSGFQNREDPGLLRDQRRSGQGRGAHDCGSHGS